MLLFVVVLKDRRIAPENKLAPYTHEGVPRQLLAEPAREPGVRLGLVEPVRPHHGLGAAADLPGLLPDPRPRSITKTSKIRGKANGDNWLRSVAKSDIENKGLVLFVCALEVKDDFKDNSRATRLRSTSGEGSHPKHFA